MLLFFLDDSCHDKPTRPKLGRLVSVGGIAVHEGQLQSLTSQIETVCSEFGFPSGPLGKFKWSPGNELWMHKGLVTERRTGFYRAVLQIVSDHKVQAFVCCVDANCQPAISDSATPENDVVKLALERVEHWCKTSNENALLVFDRPPGNQADGDKFLAKCVESLVNGTAYVQPKHVLIPPLASNSALCRPLQVADVVVSATTALVAGESRYSPQILEQLISIYYKPHDCIGGWGVKLHPSRKLRNLYHWIFKDMRARSGLNSSPYPLDDHAFSTGPDIY